MQSLLKQIVVAVAMIAAWSLAPLVVPAPAVDHRAAIASLVRAPLTSAPVGRPAAAVMTPRALFSGLEATLEAQATRASIRLTAPYRVTVGATAVQLTSSGNVNGGVVVKALVPGQTMYLGLSGVTTATGYPMADYETLTLEVSNANQLYAIASAAAQSVAVLPFSRY